jgi:transposase
MAIVGGCDVHRAQITFDYLDTDTGEVSRGQIRPATRATLRRWLAERFAGRTDVALAVEGCTGWRFVVEELVRAGVEPHLAEPADTATLRGRKKRAKTDRADARLLRELLHQGRLPESWIPPAHVLEVRTLGRTYVDLMDERRAWQQRIHAQLFHQGVPPAGGLLTRAGRAALARVELSPAGRQQVTTALVAIDALTELILPLRAQLRAIGHRQPGCRALQAHYGIGPLTAVIIWAELGDPRRFRNSDQAVRFAGLDVTVWSSDERRSPGRLSRQGSPELRWALFEAAKAASRAGSPDHDYYTAVTERLGGKRPTLSVARKLVRRAYHTLRELGDAAWLSSVMSDELAA